jgi:hypothetical protein
MATDEQILAAKREHGTHARAALSLGISERRFCARFARLRDYDPQSHPIQAIPEGFKPHGFSTLVKPEGDGALQWVKVTRDKDAERARLEAWVAGIKDELPRIKPTPAPKGTEDDLLNLYVVTDYHLGMLAWHEETGADWDLQIAERTLIRWFERAIALSPKAGTAVFAQLGDFLHADGLDALTPQHKNLLDVDTRFPKVVRAAIRLVRRIIELLLAKHAHVRVIQAEGNHDPASSIWLREWLASIYAKEPRVSVDTSPDPYYCVEHGATSLFFHHGHKRKPANIDDVFVGKFREVFGRTKHSYAHMGHMHHVDQRETSLMIVEQHRTLAAPDAYASRGGWLSGRDAKVISYSKRWGEVGRCTVSYKQVEQ